MHTATINHASDRTLTTPTLEHRIEQDMHQHIEDDLIVNAIRNGKLVQVHWNDLTEDERVAARNVLFGIYQ